MTTKQIYIEPMRTGFEVQLKDANRQKRNRSFSNASPCCQAALKQEKRCGKCGESVATADCKHKIVKLGKQEYIIETDALKQVQDSLAQSEKVSVHTFLDALPEGAEDRYDALVYAYPVDKKELQYAELRSLLDGKVAVGTAVLRSNEYQVVLIVGADGVLRMRKLVEESQRYDFSPAAVKECLDGISPREQVVQLGRKLIQKATVENYDVTEFRDARSEYEERIIEEYVLHGKTPRIAQEVKHQQEQDEVARLQALLEA